MDYELVLACISTEGCYQIIVTIWYSVRCNSTGMDRPVVTVTDSLVSFVDELPSKVQSRLWEESHLRQHLVWESGVRTPELVDCTYVIADLCRYSRHQHSHAKCVPAFFMY